MKRHFDAQNLSSALFPLLLLLALIGLTYWLRLANELPSPQRDGKHRHDPDYIVYDGTLRKIDATGALKYTLTAKEIVHFPDDDSTEMKAPNFVQYNPSKPTMRMKADFGRMSRDGEQVDLYDNVRLHRAATAKDPETIGTTTQLTILPDEEKAYTREPVLITQGKSMIKGVGLQVDGRKQTYLLESRASAVIESKHARKQP